MLSYDQFVSTILVGKMKIASLVVGYDHRFGQGRKGNFNSLESLSSKLEFKVEQLSELFVDNQVVSSTKIRSALEAGDILTANHFLGYQYTLSGKVIKGQQLGREIGFPTANIDTNDQYKLVPGDGVYAVMVEWEGKRYKGMLNIGIRPTVNHNADHKTIEVYIFDFDKDIYDSEIALFFIEKFRDEQKFDGLAQLQKQLINDQKLALKILSKENF
jgi:riboflavin kinase / FMN adenylyltransferase